MSKNESVIYGLGTRVDEYSEHSDILGLEKTIDECHAFIESISNEGPDAPLVHYFVANAHSAIRIIKESKDKSSSWAWESHSRSSELLSLRKATTHKDFIFLDDTRKCQIFTNLGNLFNNTGRTLQALNYWSKAIAVDSFFSMAVFNKAQGLRTLANLLYDDGHKYLIHNEAYKLARLIHDKQYTNKLESFSAQSVYQDASQYCNWWESVRSEYAQTLGMHHRNIEEYSESLGNSAQEIEYGKWCLKNTLFINPLNELGPHSLAAFDPFMLPNMNVQLGEGPYFFAMMQQLKQEYISARFMLYQGIHNNEQMHFSDSTIDHIDTLDAPEYGYWLETLKSSFKMAYGILDKIGCFLNEYLSLKIDKKRLYFRTLWYKKNSIKKGLREEFQELPNLPLRGLHWLSKDLMNSSQAIEQPQDYLDPEAQNIAIIRNEMEHGYLRVVGFRDIPSAWEGDFAMKITYSELVEKSLHVLKLAREALFYLGLSVCIEETMRAHEGPIIQNDLPYIP